MPVHIIEGVHERQRRNEREAYRHTLETALENGESHDNARKLGIEAARRVREGAGLPALPAAGEESPW
jgi:hypothetical protein